MSSSSKSYGTVSTTAAETSAGATTEPGLSVTHFPAVHPGQAVHAAVHEDKSYKDMEGGAHYTRRKGCVAGVLEVVRANTGLLLVVVAQACFAMMNTAIQRLHKVDPPVTTLQVCFSILHIEYIGLRKFIGLFLSNPAYDCTNGA